MVINYTKALFAIGLVVFGYLFAKRISAFADQALSTRFSKHHAMLTRRLLFYALFLTFFVAGLQQLGFNMTVLLGAAGVFTVALSFASQTAASNLISGIFLIFEQPFKVGDAIDVKGLSGIVDSIDLLSTKIKTADNTIIRIPNESLMKSDIKNMSCFRTKRIDIPIHIDYQNNIQHVKTILLDIANKEPSVLQEPPAELIVSHFGLIALELTLMVWTKTRQVTSTKNKLTELIQQRLKEEEICRPSSSPADTMLERTKTNQQSNGL